MAKFIDVWTCYLKDCDKDIVVRGKILLNVENIKWIQMERFSSGYVIKVVTGEDYYAYAWEIAEESEAYNKMFKLQDKLNEIKEL